MAESEMQTALSPALQRPPKRPVRATVGGSRAIRQHLPVLCALHAPLGGQSSISAGDRRLWPEQQSWGFLVCFL